MQVEGGARFRSEAMEVLRHYSWPGNVRELENVVERALILKKSGELGLDILPPTVKQETGGIFAGEIPDDGVNLDEIEVELIRKALKKAGGNQTKAARYLGLSRPTLIYRIEKYGIQ